jgi:hypothetical protein
LFSHKKFLYLFLAFVYIWSWSIFNVLNASERVINTTGHIIVETVKGTDIDQMKVLEGELQNLAHKFALEIIPIIEASLPLIMDRVMTDLRLELDKQHKCLLLKDSKIKDKDCQ